MEEFSYSLTRKFSLLIFSIFSFSIFTNREETDEERFDQNRKDKRFCSFIKVLCFSYPLAVSLPMKSKAISRGLLVRKRTGKTNHSQGKYDLLFSMLG